MDPELRSALDALDRKIDASAVETRAYADGLAADARAYADRLAAELRAHMDAVAAELRAHMGAVAAESRRHTAVLMESLRSDFRVATEVLLPMSGRVTTLEQAREDTHRRLDGLETRVGRLERSGRPRPPRGRRKRS